MHQKPWVQIPIVQILDEKADGIRVLTPAGRRPWLPKGRIEYVWGAVLVPQWLADKILKSKPPLHEEVSCPG